MNKAATTARAYEEMHDQREKIRAAIRLIEAGKSFNEAEKLIGIPRVRLEKALIEAKDRQELIRRHLQTRRDFTSLLRYFDRGPWGDAGYFGNCNGYLLIDLIDYFKPASVFDPMEGSGTTGDVCFDLKLDYLGYDLRKGFDLLSSPIPDRCFDLIFWHPPYWPGRQYSDHPNDFSNSEGYKDFLDRIQQGIARFKGLLTSKGHLAILIGDGRKQGVFYPIHSEIIQWNLLPLEAVVIKDGQHERRANYFRYGPTRFIPTLHEYLLIFKRGGV